MIYAMHGVVRHRRDDLFEQRNLVDCDEFESYLRDRPPFVDLHSAMQGVGDALTIDDATVAAADAARLAISHGQKVTVFINGSNVEHQYPYCFAVVNRLLDHAQVQTIRLQGKEHPVATFLQKKQFRRLIKQEYRHLKIQAQELAFTELLATHLRVEHGPVSDQYRVLTRDDLWDLIALGVEVGNHGWNHVDPQHLSVGEFKHQVSRNRLWIRDSLGVDSPFYAVPFGDTLPPPVYDDLLFERCFLLTESAPPLKGRDELINRRDLTL